MWKLKDNLWTMQFDLMETRDKVQRHQGLSIFSDHFRRIQEQLKLARHKKMELLLPNMSPEEFQRLRNAPDEQLMLDTAAAFNLFQPGRSQFFPIEAEILKKAATINSVLKVEVTYVNLEMVINEEI
jgi:hypothetical protein